MPKTRSELFGDKRFTSADLSFLRENVAVEILEAAGILFTSESKE
jgi:hypothetical protein